MTVTPKRYAEIRVLADRLIASCDGGADGQDEIEAMTLEENGVLDSMAFECTQCNQWSARSEQHEDESGQWVCTDCAK
jgi:hypothetical protein